MQNLVKRLEDVNLSLTQIIKDSEAALPAELQRTFKLSRGTEQLAAQLREVSERLVLRAWTGNEEVLKMLKKLEDSPSLGDRIQALANTFNIEIDLAHLLDRFWRDYRRIKAIVD